MNILTIDAGNYSVKFLHGKFDQKKLTIFDHHEVVINEVQNQFPEETPLEEIQLSVIKSYLDQVETDGKIIFQFPNESLTTRFLDLPVTNRKKADQMIPFQLDENLPFSTSKAHYTKNLIKTNDGFRANIYVCEKEYFEEYYNELERSKILPNILTSESSVAQSYVDLKKINGNFCILDIGHVTAKAYFFSNNDLVASHTSYTAGSVINEVISETYQIPLEEAIIYKHNNSFFLTDDQIEKVSSDQADFARLMKSAFQPLIHDFNRWQLGHRINTGSPIEKIFLTGGSSNIKNIENFLMSELGISATHLPHKNLENEIGAKESHSFSLAYMMGLTQKSKMTPVNFLVKEFASSSSAGIPLKASSFVAFRVLAFSLFLIGLLVVERQVFLTPKEKKLNAKVLKTLKDPALELKSSIRRLYRKSPDKVLTQLQRKSDVIRQDVKSIMAATRIDAVSPLVQLASAQRKNDQIDLIKFTSDSYSASAVYKSEELRELQILEKHLKSQGLTNLKIDLNKETLVMEVSFEI